MTRPFVPTGLFADGWHKGMSDVTYHADRTAVSSSQLRRMLKSPAAFKHALENPPWAESDALRLGRLVHQVILDGNHFLKTYVVAPDFKASFGHPNSNLHKGAKADWLADQAGRVVVTSEEYDAIEGMLESIVGHADACALLKNGEPEVSGYYRDEPSGVRCRIRPDFINRKAAAIVDLKTTVDGSAAAFARSVWNYRYDFQLAMYGAGYEAIEGKEPEFYVFIAVEKTAPYECSVYACDREMIQVGRADYARALMALKASREGDYWPQAQAQIETLSLPRWAIKDVLV